MTGGPALAGIRVIDLTTVVFGPSASQALADYGADVIKIEAPGGDTTRQTGPSAEPGMASLFLGSNRNKRSVVLDLKTAEGRAALLALTDTADVFMHNVLPHKIAAMGLAPEVLRERNPRLIYAALHGFGQDGPYAGRPAYDDVVQALSGAADLCRRQLGTPRYMPTIVADKVGGQMAVHAILAALFQRERTGRGQLVEIPMFEAMVQFLMVEHFYARQIAPDHDPDAQPTDDMFGYRRTLAEWRKPYPTRDSHVCFMPYNDRDWAAFFAEVGRPELADDERFVSAATRAVNIEPLYRLLEEIMVLRTTAQWLDVGARLGIACAPVNTMADLEQDPHLAAVGLFGRLDAGEDWAMRYVRAPVILSESHVVPMRPPRLGEHTREVLSQLPLSEATIAAILGCEQG